jgi:hypothetical protein
LTDRPEASSRLPPLAEVLRAVRIDSAIYLNGEFSEPWCVDAPEAKSMAQLLGRDGAHVIVYHLLCEGRARCELAVTPSISRPAISSPCRTGILTGSATGSTQRQST